MAVLHVHGLGETSKRQLLVDRLGKVEKAVKKVDASATAEEVLAAAEEAIREVLGLPASKKKK